MIRFLKRTLLLLVVVVATLLAVRAYDAQEGTTNPSLSWCRLHLNRVLGHFW